MKEHSPVERHKLLDTTLEDLVLADQAPPSKMLRVALGWAGSAHGGQSAGPAAGHEYLARLQSKHIDLHGKPQRRCPQERKQRRDSGVTKMEEDMANNRNKTGAPLPEE